MEDREHYINCIDKLIRNSEFLTYPSKKAKKKAIKRLESLKKKIMRSEECIHGYNTKCLD